MGGNSWGYNDENGNAVIPIGKYKFLNPIDQKGMIYANKGTKYGYIDIHENILIPFEYDALTVFSEDVACVKKNEKYGFINRKGKIIIPIEFEDETYFQKTGLALVKKNSLYGFINKKGKEVIPIIYENGKEVILDSLVILNKKGKWAFFDSFGKQKTDFVYDEITTTSFNSKDTFWKNGLILVRKNSLIAYLDKNLNEVIPFGKYDFGERFNQNRLAIVSKNHLYGIINEFGKEVVKTQYDTIEHPTEYYNESAIFAGRKNNYFVLFDEKGDKVADKINEFHFDGFKRQNKYQKIFQIKSLNGLYGIIDNAGKTIIPNIYEEIQDFNGNQNTVVKYKGKFEIISSDNKIVYSIDNDAIETWKDLNYYIISKNHKTGILDKNLKPILNFDYQDLSPCYYDKNLFIAKQNDKYGVINKIGRIIIPFEYSKMSNWVEYGPGENYHFVAKNNKEGLITKEGKIVIPLIYDTLFYNNDKTIILSKNKKYGVLTIQNKIVIPFIYEKIYTDLSLFSKTKETEFYVLQNGKYSIVNSKNKTIRSNISKDEVEDKFSYLN
ncbi:WG repeat-containing protein [Flavobacterium sp. MC2016-06]|uniref:WG repeat-containing protein n=1 Tax=Flavobacterium sp. MC2016-06 TaxID=2676308 RepID=UPI0018AC9973|nr:WG repeat-containing protein [Flavobacterium sp. MC2016-06]MBU3857932.1 WG repeat-containing protein [Flavobacterium sp. MC2016-06]